MDETPASPPSTPASERVYRGPDRRSRPTPMISRYLFTGRRRGARREGEDDYAYVDRPGAWTWVAFGLVVGLSMLDASFTLSLLRRGATEANPVMQAALQLGEGAFVFVKTFVTILAAGFLCLHKNWPLGRLCLAIAIGGYLVLTAYHVYAQHAIA